MDTLPVGHQAGVWRLENEQSGKIRWVEIPTHLRYSHKYFPLCHKALQCSIFHSFIIVSVCLNICKYVDGGENKDGYASGEFKA